SAARRRRDARTTFMPAPQSRQTEAPFFLPMMESLRGHVLQCRHTFCRRDREKPAVGAGAPSNARDLGRDRRAQALFDGIDDAVFVHDPDGRILDANPAACRRLGYTREEFLSLSTRDLDEAEFAAGFAQRLEQ